MQSLHILFIEQLTCLPSIGEGLPVPDTGLQPVSPAQVPFFFISRLKSTVISYKALNLHCQHEALFIVHRSQPVSQLPVC